MPSWCLSSPSQRAAAGAAADDDNVIGAIAHKIASILVSSFAVKAYIARAPRRTSDAGYWREMGVALPQLTKSANLSRKEKLHLEA